MVMLETLQTELTSGEYTMSNKTLTTPKIDQIDEATAGAGVTIDGVVMKDNQVFAYPGTGNVGSFISVLAFNVEDDAAASFTPVSGFGIILFHCRSAGQGAVNGMANYRTATTNFMVGMITGTNVVFGTGALTGTTGTDGKVTLSAAQADGKLYIENRLGATRSFSIILLGN